MLKEVDLIAAEDTRVTIKLLSHYGISTPMTSYHEHNEVTRGRELIGGLKAGKKIALVSDAGMPGISDPGHRLIKACIEEGIPVEPVPGPSALITTIVISGLPTDSFIFQGFLPKKKGERIALLNELLNSGRTVVLFESPKRLKRTLEEASGIDPSVDAVVARELTKKFEEVIRGTVSELLGKLRDTEIKGEIVLLFGPTKKMAQSLKPDDLREAVVDLIKKGTRKKQAISEVAKKYGISKHLVYEAVIDIHEKDIKGHF